MTPGTIPWRRSLRAWLVPRPSRGWMSKTTVSAMVLPGAGPLTKREHPTRGVFRYLPIVMRRYYFNPRPELQERGCKFVADGADGPSGGLGVLVLAHRRQAPAGLAHERQQPRPHV